MKKMREKERKVGWSRRRKKIEGKNSRRTKRADGRPGARTSKERIGHETVRGEQGRAEGKRGRDERCRGCNNSVRESREFISSIPTRHNTALERGSDSPRANDVHVIRLVNQ